MKRVMLIIAMAITVVSCTSRSGQKLAGTKVRRAHQLVFDSTGTLIGINPCVRLINMDTLYRGGDTVRVESVVLVLE